MSPSAPSPSSYDVIVAGSGVGGCVATALLASAGLGVLVLEKNDRTGGILASYEKRGFRIDMGSHLFSRGDRGPIGQVARRLGIPGLSFLSHRIPAASRGMFECRLPPGRAGLPFFLADALRALGVPRRERLTAARMLLDIALMREATLLSLDGITIEEFIFRYTKNVPVYYLLSFLLGIYFVLPPWEVAAGEGIACFRKMFRDYRLSYLAGGAGALPRATLGYAEGRGTIVKTKSAVARVERRGDGAWRVVTAAGEEYSARAVVLNLQPADAVRLAGETSFPADYVARVQGLAGTMNAYQVKLALKRRLVEEGCIIAAVSLDGMEVGDLSLEGLRELTRKTRAGEIPDPIAVYAPVPTNYDPSLAPDGCQLIVASVYGPTRPDPADPPGKWEERILKAFARMIPGLEENLLFHDFFDIPWLGRWMGKTGSPAISTGQTPGQVGPARIPVRTPLAGLYLCGDGAGGRGIGMELAAASAIECAEAVLADLGPSSV